MCQSNSAWKKLLEGQETGNTGSPLPNPSRDNQTRRGSVSICFRTRSHWLVPDDGLRLAFKRSGAKPLGSLWRTPLELCLELGLSD